VLRDFARVYWPAALLVAFGLLVAYHFLPPVPPVHVVMATSSRDEPYYSQNMPGFSTTAQAVVLVQTRKSPGQSGPSFAGEESPGVVPFCWWRVTPPDNGTDLSQRKRRT
jgi:hypothetical protein